VVPELKYQLAHYSLVADPGHPVDAISGLREVLMANPSYIAKVMAEDDFLLAGKKVNKMIESVLADLAKKLEELHRSVSVEVDRHKVFLDVVQADESEFYDTANLAKYYDELAVVAGLYAEGTFEDLSEAATRLETLTIPISHPRRYIYYQYSQTYQKELPRFYTYEAPFQSRHPYRAEFWPIGGELL